MSLKSWTAVLCPPCKHKSPKKLQLPACTEFNGIFGTRVTACMKKQLTCLGKTGASGKNSWPQLLRILENLVQLPACKFTLHFKLVKICKLFDMMVVGRKRDAKNYLWRVWWIVRYHRKGIKCIKAPLWTNASGVCLLWRKSLKLNLQRSRTKGKRYHNGYLHPQHSNELFHLMNEPVFSVLGIMPKSCSSVTHVQTPL